MKRLLVIKRLKMIMEVRWSDRRESSDYMFITILYCKKEGISSLAFISICILFCKEEFFEASQLGIQKSRGTEVQRYRGTIGYLVNEQPSR